LQKSKNSAGELVNTPQDQEISNIKGAALRELIQFNSHLQLGR